MPSRGTLVVLVACLASARATHAGEQAPTVTVAPGGRYQAGGLYSFFLGEHWRDVWTTPIEVPVLDVGGFDGGLEPDRQGGGIETKNLHFKSRNGNTWSFRSVDKDPTLVLDPDTRASVIGDLYQDEISSAQPYGALIVPGLLDAAGILHATPRLEVLPDDPRLGPFQKYAGMVGLLEERIEHGLEGATKIAETVDLFERLEKRSDERVDARAYLRARLIDVLVGDWDRHVDQWRWARYERDGERLWVPIPRDRDQAFSRFDGVVPSIAEYYTPQLAGFGRNYAPIEKLTFSGRYIDRRFLVGLDKEEWDAVTTGLVVKLTDQVISDAVHRLPEPIYEKKGALLEDALRSRRDKLSEASREYYRLLAGDVDVRGTAKDEEFDVERKPGGTVEVAIYPRDPQTGKKDGAPSYRRTFRSEDTSEIRLYTTGGADRIVVDGPSDRAIPVRVIAPPGTVEVAGSGRRPEVYAPLPDDPVPASVLKRMDRETAARVQHYEPVRDWGSNSLFFPQLSYDPTRGAVLGAILQRTGYGFQLDPFSSVMNFAAAFSTGTGEPRFEYSLDLRTRSPVRGLLYVAYSGMDTLQYYGQGNETVRDSGLASSKFYDVRQKIFVANPMIEVPLFGPLRGRVGLQFKHASSVDGSRIISATKPEGSSGMSLGSGQVGLTADTRSGTFPSLRGVSFEVIARHTPEIFSNPAAFTKLRGQVSAGYGGRFLTEMQFSARVAGEKNWGSYPFFESAFIGGAARSVALDVTGASSGNLLRGYDLNRFAGDASVVGNAQVQIPIGKFTAALPFRYGVLGVADVGRVFVAGESSSRWHTAYGGGVWLGPHISSLDIEFASAFNATVVRSDERTSFYLFSGFSL